MFPLVVIDIETTGLDPQRDAIIEIGAIRFNQNEAEVEWQSLINPGRLIPPEITQLTGISNEMVRNAPSVQSIILELIKFTDGLPVVGQNVQFDLNFLRQQGALQENPVIDTRELASVLLPGAGRYGLSALGSQMGFEQQNAHRALDDARLTLLVFNQLYEKAKRLPLDLVDEIVEQSRGLEWGGRYFFAEVIRELSKQGIKPRRLVQKDFGVLFSDKQESFLPSLKPKTSIQLLDEDKVTETLEPGGAFENHFQGVKSQFKFENRPQQIDMLKAITRALNESRHLMIEAGTGIGKSFAYLVPAALWASTNQHRVVISTNTINLQDQLMHKDIPDLQGALRLNLRAVVLKGRSNYLCPRRLEALRHRGPQNSDELRVLAKVLVWLHEGGRGDRSELTLSGPLEQEIWIRLSAEDESCNAELCQSRMGGLCPYFHARQIAQSAHLIVVNHALLLADVITNSKVLPEYHYLIVDEAHHMESATTGALSYRITSMEIEYMLKELGGVTSGVLGNLMKILNSRVKLSDLASVSAVIHRATDLAFQLENSFHLFFRELNDFLSQEREGREVSDYGQQLRITASTQNQPGWTPVEIAWDQIAGLLDSLMKLLSQLGREAADFEHGEDDEMRDVVGDLNNLIHRMEELQTRVTALVSQVHADSINWIEIEPRNRRISLNVAPLHIGPMMEKYLWHEKDCIVLTSATLTADGEFDYLRGRLSADEADEMVLGSPFDYERSTLLYIPNDMPEPIEFAQYQKWVERTLLQVARATGGRMLALFTSYRQLRITSDIISPRLAEAGIQVYEQGEGASSSALLETFRTTDHAVLLGTKAFWEGVDVPGEKLSVLIIVKLPFDVPSDPIVAARAETFEDPFNEYNVPEAILRFRQGFGRLIRTQSDRGVVAILDRRILTKRYGPQFLHSLPQCTQRIGPVEELPNVARQWLEF